MLQYGLIRGISSDNKLSLTLVLQNYDADELWTRVLDWQETWNRFFALQASKICQLEAFHIYCISIFTTAKQTNFAQPNGRSRTV